MKYILANIFLMISLTSYSQTKITSQDLKIIIGEWEGSITYLDYSSNKPFSMPANLVVNRGKDENILILKNICYTYKGTDSRILYTSNNDNTLH